MASPINSMPNGCRRTAQFSGFKQAAARRGPGLFATSAVANDWGDRLVTRAMKYLGTPYRYGGTSPRTGFDCSGFVYYLYGATFGQSIPRMPHDMAREGTPVARSDLKRGDLFVLGHRGTFTHVGIYAGNDRFVHATQRGSPVMVTPLDSDYFRDRYMTAVKVAVEGAPKAGGSLPRAHDDDADRPTIGGGAQSDSVLLSL